MTKKNKERDYKILCDWNEGYLTKSGIASENNVSIATVYKVLNAYKQKGWHVKKKEAKFSERDLLIVQEWNASCRQGTF
mgnify:FL=1